MKCELRGHCFFEHSLFARAILSLSCLVAWSGLCGTAQALTRLEIPAWSFHRGNARVEENKHIYADYRDIHPNLVIAGGEELPWQVEYDIEIPMDSTFTISICYSSDRPRPVELWLGDRKLADCCKKATGNSAPFADRFPRHENPRPVKDFHGGEWDEACKLPIAKGNYTLKLKSPGQPPRVLALRLDSSEPFPGGWKTAGPAVLDPQDGTPRYRARRRFQLAYGPPDPKMNIERIPPRHRPLFLPPHSVNIATLRMAIEDTIVDYGPRYAKGPEYLKQLAELEERQKALADGADDRKKQVEDELQTLRRRAMLDHPLLKFEKLLFVKRTTDNSGHIYEDHYGGKVMGGNLCVLSPVAPDGKVTEIAPQLAGGRFGRFDLSFDGKRVVFAYTKGPELPFRIYEIGIDGTGLRQLSFDDPGQFMAAGCLDCKGGRLGRGYDDIDPCYLPNGKIMFASTRTQRVVFCLGTSVTTLHVMDGDGKNLHSVSEGPITEVDPCVMNDGRVVHMRWEYVDKGFGNVQSLWSMRPDGSYSDHVYKNNVVLPGGMVDARSIPGSSKLVALAVAHCGFSAGQVIVLDTRKTRRTKDAMTVVTPEIGMPGMFWHIKSTRFGFFKEPYPLSEKQFLVAHTKGMYVEPNGYGIYILDKWGNRAELYRDPETSCFQPIPLRTRLKPTEIPTVPGMRQQENLSAKLAGTDAPKTEKLATLFMQDVYRGMTGIERGRVKYLRVMEAFALPWESALRSRQQGDAANLQASAVSLEGDVHIKKVHGIVPVYEDGSAYFVAPAHKNIYFQALDEDYMELQRMRTFVNLMPGERRACIGCHEQRRTAPAATTAHPIAFNEGPATPSPQPGDTGPRVVHYPTDVQPIFDRRCVSCHSGEKPKGELDLSGTPTDLFCVSYENLVHKKLTTSLRGCVGEANVPAEIPLSFGSHRSKLVQRMLADPCKSNVTREEFIKIVTWVDANAPYYGTHEGKKHLRHREEPDFRPTPLAGK